MLIPSVRRQGLLLGELVVFVAGVLCDENASDVWSAGLSYGRFHDLARDLLHYESVKRCLVIADMFIIRVEATFQVMQAFVVALLERVLYSNNSIRIAAAKRTRRSGHRWQNAIVACHLVRFEGSLHDKCLIK